MECACRHNCWQATPPRQLHLPPPTCGSYKGIGKLSEVAGTSALRMWYVCLFRTRQRTVAPTTVAPTTVCCPRARGEWERASGVTPLRGYSRTPAIYTKSKQPGRLVPTGRTHTYSPLHVAPAPTLPAAKRTRPYSTRVWIVVVVVGLRRRPSAVRLCSSNLLCAVHSRRLPPDVASCLCVCCSAEREGHARGRLVDDA